MNEKKKKEKTEWKTYGIKRISTKERLSNTV
jgi:hypothetical protein